MGGWGWVGAWVGLGWMGEWMGDSLPAHAHRRALTQLVACLYGALPKPYHRPHLHAPNHTQVVLPTFAPLPAGDGIVRVCLAKAGRVLGRRAAEGGARAAVAGAVLDNIVCRNLVAGLEYFGRVWTLAERLARCVYDCTCVNKQQNEAQRIPYVCICACMCVCRWEG